MTNMKICLHLKSRRWHIVAASSGLSGLCGLIANHDIPHQDLIQSGQVKVKYVPSEDNAADSLTIALAGAL
jgi:hypothetical protein